jgi:hypothetical protein
MEDGYIYIYIYIYMAKLLCMFLPEYSAMLWDICSDTVYEQKFFFQNVYLKRNLELTRNFSMYYTAQNQSEFRPLPPCVNDWYRSHCYFSGGVAIFRDQLASWLLANMQMKDSYRFQVTAARILPALTLQFIQKVRRRQGYWKRIVDCCGTNLCLCTRVCSIISNVAIVCTHRITKAGWKV